MCCTIFVNYSNLCCAVVHNLLKLLSMLTNAEIRNEMEKENIDWMDLPFMA